MTAFANMTINDGQATPVAHTFTARRIDEKGVAKWQDISGGVPIGYITITASLKEPPVNMGSSNRDAEYVARYKVALPILETLSNNTFSGVNPAPTKAYDLIADSTYRMSERSALADRKNLLAYHVNGLAQPQIRDLIWNLDFVA